MTRPILCGIDDAQEMTRLRNGVCEWGSTAGLFSKLIMTANKCNQGHLHYVRNALPVWHALSLNNHSMFVELHWFFLKIYELEMRSFIVQGMEVG